MVKRSGKSNRITTRLRGGVIAVLTLLPAFRKFRERLHETRNRRLLLRQATAEFEQFKAMSAANPRFSVNWDDRLLCLNDRTTATAFDRHYLYHTAWAARILAHLKPEYHVDIGSFLYFPALVSAFIPVRFYDYRPADLTLPGLTCESADLNGLPFQDRSIKSLSCMHVLEHVGLGRYGDLLAPDGDLRAIAEIKRVLATGGTLLIAVPVGKPKVVFNAHRVYSYEQIRGYFKDLELKDFTLIPDSPEKGGLIHDAPEDMVDAQIYGCGCFWFMKESDDKQGGS